MLEKERTRFSKVIVKENSSASFLIHFFKDLKMSLVILFFALLFLKEASSYLRFNKYVDTSYQKQAGSICNDPFQIKLKAVVGLPNKLIAAYSDRGQYAVLKMPKAPVNYPSLLNRTEKLDKQPNLGFSLWAYKNSFTTMLRYEDGGMAASMKRVRFIETPPNRNRNPYEQVQDFTWLRLDKNVAGVIEIPTKETPRAYYYLVFSQIGQAVVCKVFKRATDAEAVAKEVTNAVVKDYPKNMTTIALFNVIEYIKENEPLGAIVSYGNQFGYMGVEFSLTPENVPSFTFSYASPEFESGALFGCPPQFCLTPHIDAMVQQQNSTKLMIISGNFWWEIDRNQYAVQDISRVNMFSGSNRNVEYVSNAFGRLGGTIECAYIGRGSRIVFTTWRNVWEGATGYNKRFYKYDKDKYFNFKDRRENVSRTIEFTAAFNDLMDVNRIYFFNQNYYYTLYTDSDDMINNKGPGTFLSEPELIGSDWKGLPPDIDAASTDYTQGQIYIVKGNFMYIYTKDHLSDGIPPALKEPNIDWLQGVNSFFECRNSSQYKALNRPGYDYQEHKKQWQSSVPWFPQTPSPPVGSNYWQNALIAVLVFDLFGVSAIFVALYLRRPSDSTAKVHTHPEKSSTKHVEPVEPEKGLIERHKETFLEAKLQDQ